MALAAPVPGAHFFALDEGGVLFCEPAQRFYDLNATASLCWLGVADGLSESAILDELMAAGAPGDAARTWLQQSLAIFESEGFLAGSAAPATETPNFTEWMNEPQQLERIPHCVTYRFYRLFDTRFRVGFTSEAPLPGVESMLARLTDSGERPPDVEITVIGVGERFLVARGMTLVGVAATLKHLMEKIENALVLTAIDATAHLLSLHGGALMKNGCGLLLPAPSGSGKTTLTASLNYAGWDYGTDEISLLDGKALRVAPQSACIKEGSWPVLAERCPPLLTQPVHERAGRTVRYLPPAGRVVERCQATHVVFPRYAKDGETSLSPLARGAGLQRLLAECVSVPRRLTEADAGQLVAWARNLAFFSLPLGDVDAAIALLDGLASPT